MKEEKNKWISQEKERLVEVLFSTTLTMDATNQQQMLTDSDDPTTDHIVTDATPLLATEATAIDDSNLETPETINWSTNILSEVTKLNLWQDLGFVFMRFFSLHRFLEMPWRQ